MLSREDKLKRIARYCVTSGTQNTTDGKWSVSYDELSHHFGVDKTDINGNAQFLADMLNQQEEINDLMMTEDCIEMTYHMEHCPLCRQGGIAGALALSSVLGCNITDEHEEPKYKPLPYDEVETKLARQILWLYAGEGEQQCFSRCEISNQSFIARDFPNLSFYNCRFNNVDFSEADFSYCTFENCDFVDCDLSYVKAEGADFTGSDFCESTLRDARFDTCNFKGAKLNEVHGWPRLQFCCIEDADFGEDDETVDLDDCRESETEWEAERDSNYLETQVL